MNQDKKDDDMLHTKEQLSALMDDALEDEEKETLLNKLKKDPELQKTWQCFHLIRSILQPKNERLLLGYGAMLSAKVSAQLANEPPVVWGAEFDKPLVVNTTVSNDERNVSEGK
ncbi:MAG: sigma-E factor negative regulatory protein [Proteobacteria bacterium]|nr:sigma-E factor negative regulatory protein [Pseudomonadota bacterium]